MQQPAVNPNPQEEAEERRQRQIRENQALIDLLDEWIQEDAETETAEPDPWDELRQALEENPITFRSVDP